MNKNNEYPKLKFCKRCHGAYTDDGTRMDWGKYNRFKPLDEDNICDWCINKLLLEAIRKSNDNEV
jgi:hypothetical protein